MLSMEKIQIKDIKKGQVVKERVPFGKADFVKLKAIEDSRKIEGELVQWVVNVKVMSTGEIIEILQTEGLEHYGPSLFI